MSKVYSTRFGRLCSECEQPIDSCICPKRGELPLQGDGIVRVRKEVQGRKGKPVTTISGVLLSDQGLKDLARSLKQKLGTGGSVKNGIIEIQGDQRDLIIAELKKRGYKVKG